MRRLKIGITPQLIILVCFSSLFSLLILALVTTVYFSSSLSNSRAERLEVISELKSTQVGQALQYTYYQIYGLTTRDTINSALSSYRAGNYSKAVFAQAQTTLDQLLTSSELFAAARLYNLDLDVVAESYNNLTAISQPTMDALYPFAKNATVPAALQQPASDADAYYTGPVSNSTDINSSYFMGITLPVFANTSIIFPEPTLAGYLSILASASNIQDAINDTSTFGSSSTNTTTKAKDRDYAVIAVRPVYDTSITYSNGGHKLAGFETIFPVSDQLLPNTFYDIDTSPSVKTALTRGSGSQTNVKDFAGNSVAIGFDQISLNDNTVWTIIIEQPRSAFYAPVNKLVDIIIGVVIGTGVFMCLLTFPLAVWFIRPITKLKNATDSIAQSKLKLKKLNQASSSALSASASPHSKKGNHDPNNGAIELSKRNSVNSVSTGNTSAHSTAIRLPGKIPNSKKLFKDELTELTEAFNIMTDELDKQYTHLEDRVKSRTKELEASKIEAEAANEAKTVFIANISHELRTPLNGILGMTSIAMDEEDHTRIQDSLKLIHRSGELLLHILTELLTYSKNTLNRSKLEKSNFQILEVVYQVKSIFTKLALDQRVNFKILLKPNVLRKLILYGDSNRIIQVVMNLVSNSLKFTPVDGSVGVTFKLLGEYDFVKSQQDDFKKVHVLPHTRVKKDSPASSNGDTTLLNKTSNLSEGLFTTPQSPKNGSGPEPELDVVGEHTEAPPSSRKIDTEIDNDNISVITLSTAEYENNIFESQFNHMKPLPKLPSSTSSVKSLPENRDPANKIEEVTDEPSAANKSDTSQSEIEEEKKSSDTADEREIDEKANTSTDTSSDSKNLKAALPRSALLPAHHKRKNLTQGTFSAEHSRTRSLSSNMARHELVKNNKAFKIRSMYKPKSWAIQIEVTDTGPGIEPALQEKVFEPFIQGDQTLSRSYGGTGLGLSICRQLAAMMKGTLTLKSTFGQGSTFTFTVPLPQTGEIMVGEDEMAEFCDDEYNPNSRVNRKVAFEQTQTETDTGYEAHTDDHYEYGNSTGSSTSSHSASKQDSRHGEELTSDNSENSTRKKPDMTIDIPARPKLEKPRLVARSSTGTANSANISGNESSHNLLDDLSELHILVAEDNMVNQEVIKRMLHLEGFMNVTMACNGAEAVELVKESIEKSHPYDLILMDVQMPKIDGLLATKMIRNNLRYEKPIIALTAFADESNVRECLNSGMSGFLAKPIRRANLRKTIVKFSPVLLSEIVTTPQTNSGEEKRLGYSPEK